MAGNEIFMCQWRCLCPNCVIMNYHLNCDYQAREYNNADRYRKRVILSLFVCLLFNDSLRTETSVRGCAVVEALDYQLESRGFETR
jgi:hypothetical protein